MPTPSLIDVVQLQHPPDSYQISSPPHTTNMIKKQQVTETTTVIELTTRTIQLRTSPIQDYVVH